MLRFIKDSLWLQGLISWFFSLIPSVVEHNLGKFSAIKKAFHITALERLDGDYLEFGVFTGNSFVYALRVHAKTHELGPTKTAFFGFDSFSGFGKVIPEDRHPFYIDDIFSVNAMKIIANIRRKAKGQKVEMIEGYFQETLPGKKPADFGISKARIVLIDCDLKEPSACALRFLLPALQPGMVLILDDYYAFRGDPKKGVAGAFHEFRQHHPELQWERISDYGCGGVVFMLCSMPEMKQKT